MLRIASNRAQAAARTAGSARATMAVPRRSSSGDRCSDRRLAGLRGTPGDPHPSGSDGVGCRDRRTGARRGRHRARARRPGGSRDHHRPPVPGHRPGVPGPHDHGHRRGARNIAGCRADSRRGRQPAPAGGPAGRVAVRSVRQPRRAPIGDHRLGNSRRHSRPLHRRRDAPDPVRRWSLPADSPHRCARPRHGVAGPQARRRRAQQHGRPGCRRGSDTRHGAGRPDRGRAGRRPRHQGQRDH